MATNVAGLRGGSRYSRRLLRCLTRTTFNVVGLCYHGQQVQQDAFALPDTRYIVSPRMLWGSLHHVTLPSWTPLSDPHKRRSREICQTPRFHATCKFRDETLLPFTPQRRQALRLVPDIKGSCIKSLLRRGLRLATCRHSFAVHTRHCVEAYKANHRSVFKYASTGMAGKRALLLLLCPQAICLQ